MMALTMTAKKSIKPRMSLVLRKSTNQDEDVVDHGKGVLDGSVLHALEALSVHDGVEVLSVQDLVGDAHEDNSEENHEADEDGVDE